MNQQDNDQNNKKPNLLQIVGSVLSAGFGVQNSKNRERDFKHGSHKTFIIAGIVFTLVFIIGVYSIVQLVLKKAGA
jgi:hypothetical protein